MFHRRRLFGAIQGAGVWTISGLIDYKSLYPVPSDILPLYNSGTPVTSNAELYAAVDSLKLTGGTIVVSPTSTISNANIDSTNGVNVNQVNGPLLIRGPSNAVCGNPATGVTSSNLGKVNKLTIGKAAASTPITNNLYFYHLDFGDNTRTSGTALTLGDGTAQTVTNVGVYGCEFYGKPYVSGWASGAPTSGGTFTGTLNAGTLTLTSVVTGGDAALGQFYSFTYTGATGDAATVFTAAYTGGGSGPGTVGATYTTNTWANSTTQTANAGAGTAFTVTDTTGYKPAESPGGVASGVPARKRCASFSKNGMTVSGNYIFGYNYFHDLDFGSPRTSGVFVGNVYDMNYEDHSGGAGSFIRMYFNTFLRTVGSSDYGDTTSGSPHCDGWQYYDTSGTGITDGELIGNIFYTYGARGDNQGIFSSSMIAGNYFERFIVKGNVIIRGASEPHGLTLNRAKDCYMFSNKQLRQSNFSPANLFVGYTEAAGGILTAYDCGIANLQAGGVQTSYNALSSTGTITSNLDGPVNPLTISAAISAARWNASHPLRQYIDYTNFTIDTGLELGWVPIISRYGQTVSTQVMSNYARLMGGPASQTVSVSAGLEYQITSDSAGTAVVTAWTTSAGTMARGNYIAVRATTSGSQNTSSTFTLTINGYANSWTIVTKDTSTFPSVNAALTAYSSGTVPSSGAFSQFIYAIRVNRTTTSTVQTFINGGTSNNTFWQLNTFQIGSSSQIKCTTGVTTQNSVVTRIISFDTQYTAANYPDMSTADLIAAGLKVIDIDFATGVATRQPLSSVTWTPNATYDLNGWNIIGLLNKRDGSATNFVGDFHLLWINGYAGNMPDITDPRVYTKFSAGLMSGSNNGSTSVGDGFDLPQPHIFFGNQSGAINGGFVANKTGGGTFTNLGTLAITMTNSATGYT
jgi:hypothetical protein